MPCKMMIANCSLLTLLSFLPFLQYHRLSIWEVWKFREPGSFDKYSSRHDQKKMHLFKNTIKFQTAVPSVLWTMGFYSGNAFVLPLMSNSAPLQRLCGSDHWTSKPEGGDLRCKHGLEFNPCPSNVDMHSISLFHYPNKHIFWKFSDIIA